MPTYQPGIPTGTVPLNVDYQNLQDNFNQLNVVYGVDHLPYTNATAQLGYHTAIHLVPVSTTTSNAPNNQPINGYTATPGFGQIFSAQINDGLNTDEALYFLSGGNRLMQLTRNFQPSINTNGSTFLPGGLILQWGVKTLSIAGTITFSTESPGNNIAFPNNCFTVWCQLFQNTVNSNAGSVNLKVNTNLSFTYVVSGTGPYTGFYWFAIGN